MTITPRPPMAKAARHFLVRLQLPEESADGRKDYALLLLIHSLLLHATGIQEKSESVTCKPSLLQLAQLMHCSPRQVQRVIDRARKPGMLTSKRRGDGLSSEFTVYRTPRSATTPYCVASETNNCHDNSGFSHDNNAVQPRHLEVQPRHTTVSTSGVDLQGRSPSGVVLQGASTPQSQKPTATPCSSSERQIQHQKLRLSLLESSRELLRELEIPEKYEYVGCDSIAYLMEHNEGTSASDVISAIRSKAMSDKADGISIDAGYLITRALKISPLR